MTRYAAHSQTVRFEKERGVTEVSVTRGVAHATVEFSCETREALAAEQLHILQALAVAQVPIFLIKLHPTGISFALYETQVENGARLLDSYGSPHVLLRNLALITTFAGAMRDLSGVIANIYEGLVGAGISVRQTSDAYNAVLCLVSGDRADEAAALLRERFSLNAEKPAMEDETAGGRRPGSVNAL